jgi:hypothetical protein
VTATPPSRTNPYVGPRAFEQGETLYGRDLEVMQLLHLLLAERIVLLYSLSGAGKTSLIQAALIPRLEEEGFGVLPPMRVSLGLSADEPVDSSSNRYVLSLLLSLEEALPPEQRTSLDELSALSLGDYLDRRQDGDGAVGTVLIFDQFEEILTLDPTDRELKLEFFAQVGAALQDRRRWALFAVREEFIAALEDPYLRPIPTRLRARYRLGLLAQKHARQAMQGPASAAGVTFTDAAAEKLAENLSRVRVLQPDGSTKSQPGLYVEPAQLQVVCRRLWDLLPEGASQIVEEDIGPPEDVDLILSGYYEEQVKAALSGYYADQVQAAKGLPSRLGVYGKAFAATLGFGLTEGTIRNWFDGKLITEQGIRDQVLEGPEESEGLDNRAIRPLVGAHLVRAERRRGATWLELAHDRLIEPVQASNAAWRRARLTRRIAVGFTLIAILAIALAIWAAIAQMTIATLEDQLTALTVTVTPTTVTATPTTTVTPVPAINNPPVAVNDIDETDEDTAVTIDVAGNDIGPNLDAASANSRCAHGSIGCIGAAHGTLADSGNGTITYTPDPDWNGSDGFVYEICDSGTPALCDTAAVVITVTAISDSPVASDDSGTTMEGTTVTINVADNDIDVDGNLDATSANTKCGVCSLPANGSLQNNGTGSFDYTPDAEYYGPDSFVYQICDSATPALCDTAAVVITVTAINNPPTVTISTPMSGTILTTGDPITFTGSASDAEDEDVTDRLEWVSSIDGAIDTGGSFTRSDLSVGTHTITATATDSGELTGMDEITITVNPANTPPTATISAPANGATFGAGDPMTFTGSASDAEDEDEEVTASLEWVSSIDGSIDSGGSFSTSDLSAGTHTISATATDSGGLTASDEITIEICAEVQGPFARLWRRYRNELGCPLDERPKAIHDAEQVFENGRMLWRAEDPRIYVLYERGEWAGKYQEFPDGPLECDGSAGTYPCDDSPPQGLWPPERGFRVAWCYLCDRLARIGWGLAGERGFGPGYGDPLVQDFEGGLIFRDSEGKTQRQVYILFADGTFVRVGY